MPKYLIFIFLFTFLNFSSNSQAREKLMVVTDEWAPFIYSEDGKTKGFDYEVMVAVFSDLGNTIDFQILPWKRCLKMIENQQADAILDISLNESRKKTMYFPSESISDGSSVLFYLKGKKYSYENMKDLKGLTIGTLLGYEYEKNFMEADYFTKVQVKNEEQNIRKLMIGRIDMFLASKSVALFRAKNMGVLDKIDFIPKAIITGYNYVAFSKKPGHDKLAADFSKSLKKFKMTPEYKTIRQKYGHR